MTTATATATADPAADSGTAPSEPAPPRHPFIIVDSQRNGASLTLQINSRSIDAIEDEAARGAAGMRRARQVLADVQAAFLQTAHVQELNQLRGRLGQINDNLRDAQRRADSARSERAAAFAIGSDDELDAIDARLRAAEADIAKFNDRGDELRKMVNAAEAKVKAALAEKIKAAAVGHSTATAEAVTHATARLAEAMAPALNDLFEAQAASDAAYRLRRGNLDEFTTV